MPKHLNKNGFFQSDKHPELPEHKFMLDFRDEYAQMALRVYANCCADKDLAADILFALHRVQEAGLTKKPD